MARIASDATIAAMPFPHRPPAVAAMAAVLVLAIAGCDGAVGPSPTSSASPIVSPTAVASPPGSADASPTGSEDLAAIYAAINQQVQDIRGLDEREPVEPQVVSSDELADVLERQIREETPADLLSAYERLYQAVSLMPRDQSLADVYVDLLESQVAGLYVPGERSLYVLSKEGGVGAIERVLYAHEYEHALQDQHFDLRAIQPEDLVDDTDRQLARQALVEGDAYVLMSQWLQRHLTPAELLEVLAASNDDETIKALEDIPPIVSNQILFPATHGFLWAMGVQAGGGWQALDAAFADPPDSTEQILHQDKWASREPPIEVELPDDLAESLGERWDLTLEDGLGEHQIGVWLTGSVPTGAFPPAPPEAAVGWGGDRLAFLEGPDDGWAVAIATEWDTAADADEFHDAIVEHASDWPSGLVTAPADTNEVWVLIASDATIATRLESALGLVGV
jgi:hypothetical protein